MAPSASRKTVMAESWRRRLRGNFFEHTILPNLASVPVLEVGHNLDDFTLGQDKRDHDETECGMKNVSPRRIIGMLAAWPYHSMEAGVTRGFSSAQATPEMSVYLNRILILNQYSINTKMVAMIPA